MKINFKQIQYNFSHHMRDPEKNPAPTGIEDRRLAIYRELIYNNIESFMANGFPVLRKITSDDNWHKMIRGFVSEHKSKTPYFPKLTTEFINYLQYERSPDSNDFPFMLELVHYECMESLIIFDPTEINEVDLQHNGDLLSGLPVLSPLIITGTYIWPVHRISPDYLPEKPPDKPSYLLIYRRRNFSHGFMTLNQVTAKLIEYLNETETTTGKEILMKIAADLNMPDPKQAIAGGLEIMKQLLDKDIILGVRQPL